MTSNFLVVFSSFLLISCLGGGSGDSQKEPPKESYSIKYNYPANTLLPGDGVVQVFPESAYCLNENNKKIADNELCPGIDQVDLSQAPTRPYKSPAGPLEVITPNATTLSVIAQIEEGIHWPTIADASRRSKLAPLVVCSDGYSLNFRGDCVEQGFAYSYGQWPSNTLSSCSGTQVVTRTYICIDEVSGISVDYFFCSNYGLVPDINRTYSSPTGTSTMTGTGGDVLNITCQEGKTASDVGNGTIVNSVASCGMQRHLASPTDLTCTPNAYIADQIIYPENNMLIGEGARVVTATGFSQCRSSHDNSLVDISLCSGISVSHLTETQLSPAGDIPEINIYGDSLIYHVAQGGTKISPDTAITVNSCGTSRNKQGNACFENTYTASQFSFPLNDMTPGQGSRVVNATTFNLCTRDHDSTVVDNSFCSMPSSIPTETQLSPSGDLFIEIQNAVNGGVYLAVEEGFDYFNLTDQEKNDLYDPLLVCNEGFEKTNGLCGTGAKTMASFQGGVNFSCYIDENSDVNCIGSNTTKQIGWDSSEIVSHIPMKVDLPNKVKKISTGTGHACAILITKELYCWGGNSSGQVGNGETEASRLPVKVLENVIDVNANTASTCAIVSTDSEIMGAPYCWGYNITGQLGVGNKTDRSIPTPVNGGFTAKKIDLGAGFGCLIDSSDQLRCWGSNSNGQLGDGTTIEKLSPNLVSSLVNVSEIRLGGSHLCALSNNNFYCWGKNTNGQIGDGTKTGVLTPKLSTVGAVKDFITGADHTCAIKTSDDNVYCWGRNSNNQVGDGATIDVTAPFNTLVTATSLGRTNNGTCAFMPTGNPFCWGNNGGGSLGIDPAITRQPTPIKASFVEEI